MDKPDLWLALHLCILDKGIKFFESMTIALLLLADAKITGYRNLTDSKDTNTYTWMKSVSSPGEHLHHFLPEIRCPSDAAALSLKHYFRKTISLHCSSVYFSTRSTIPFGLRISLMAKAFRDFPAYKSQSIRQHGNQISYSNTLTACSAIPIRLFRFSISHV